MVKIKIISPPKSSDGKNGEQLAIENGFELHPYRNAEDRYEGKAWYRNIPRRVFEKYGIIMKGLPRGYALAGKPDYTGRVNRYIFGHPTKKTYRSATEFAPHIRWLYQDKSKRKECECHLCIYATNIKTRIKSVKLKKSQLSQQIQQSTLKITKKVFKNKSSTDKENEQGPSPITKRKINNKIRTVSYVYIEPPPNRHTLPIPDYIDIPDLTLPTHHCLC